jgi:hypothetical protein
MEAYWKSMLAVNSGEEAVVMDELLKRSEFIARRRQYKL